MNRFQPAGRRRSSRRLVGGRRSGRPRASILWTVCHSPRLSLIRESSRLLPSQLGRGTARASCGPRPARSANCSRRRACRARRVVGGRRRGSRAANLADHDPQVADLAGSARPPAAARWRGRSGCAPGCGRHRRRESRSTTAWPRSPAAGRCRSAACCEWATSRATATSLSQSSVSHGPLWQHRPRQGRVLGARSLALSCAAGQDGRHASEDRFADVAVTVARLDANARSTIALPP